MAQRSGRGFTLIELMIVVAILGILAVVAIPAFVRYMRVAKTAEQDGVWIDGIAGAIGDLDCDGTYASFFQMTRGVHRNPPTPWTQCGISQLPMVITNETE